jgi:multisubunit Na+/H+ antiporter MnhC subunit
MLEGGWSFDQANQDSAPVDWSSGNALDTTVFAVLLYTVFLLSAKMELRSNMVLYAGLLFLYILNTQRKYWTNRQMITPETDAALVITTHVLAIGCLLFMLVGIYRYGKKQRLDKGDDFRYGTFFLGAGPCEKTKIMGA